MAGYVLWLGRLKKRQYVVTIIRFYAVDTATAAAESILREAGFGADIARFTKPADLLRHCEWELVPLDIEMPGLDGFGLGCALKPREPAPEMIYISNRAIEGDGVVLLEFGNGAAMFTEFALTTIQHRERRRLMHL